MEEGMDMELALKQRMSCAHTEKGVINVPDDTVGTLTDLANELVLCVDDELLVQDWE
jgi:hypothetical protein